MVYQLPSSCIRRWYDTELAVVATSYVVAGPLAAASLAPAATLSLVAFAATAAALPFSLRRLGVSPSSGPLGRPW